MNLDITSFFYKNFLKRILFIFDAERVHDFAIRTGEIFGKNKTAKRIVARICYRRYKNLEQKIDGISFENPIGLAAGFDYEAALIDLLPSLNFGFETIGTITNNAYEGNPRPRLGRLPKSKSLLVYKGYKNKGAIKISQKLANRNFDIPIGISIGITNSKALKTQKQSIDDIIKAFKIFEENKINNSYFELNISCPNLQSNIDFYSPKNLDELLEALSKLHLKKPIFIKMPIDKTNAEILEMLKIITKHKINGVIFGNLQTNRNHPELDKTEMKKFKKGNFSGKPTQKRSDELIALTYKHSKRKLLIIGTGGIFSAVDAYRKIKLGANLVQLITGLIFEGPQLVSQINRDLSLMLKKDGFKNISQIVGIDNQLVGRDGIEPSTSSLSEKRSNR